MGEPEIGVSEVESMDVVQTQQIDAYIEKRAVFPVEEMDKYSGCWIAFSPDGSSILGSGKSLDDLRKGLRETYGGDLDALVFERIPTDDMIVSGSELS